MGCTILFFVLLLALCPTLRINYRRPNTLNSDKVKKETLSERQGGIQFVILFERTHFLLIELAQVSWSRDFKICWSYTGELLKTKSGMKLLTVQCYCYKFISIFCNLGNEFFWIQLFCYLFVCFI